MVKTGSEVAVVDTSLLRDSENEVPEDRRVVPPTVPWSECAGCCSGFLSSRSNIPSVRSAISSRSVSNTEAYC